MSTSDIVVIGSNMVDLITYSTRMPQEGETLQGTDFAMGCGGKGANQAVAAARSGASVAMVTRVGDDLFGENARANLLANGVDTGQVTTTDAATSGVAPIFVDQEGRNRILIVPGANASLNADDVARARPAIARCKLLVMQLEIPFPTVYAALEVAAEEGVPVLLNPAPASTDLDLDAISSCEFLVPNESELQILTGRPVDSLEQVRSAAQVLVRRGITNVIVTMGHRGVLWLSRDADVLVPAERVEAVDTTGAGDAFIGAFSHEMVRSRDIRQAIEAGNRYAAVSVTRRGTQSSFPHRDELITTEK